MSTREHLLTIIEPTLDGDATADFAVETVARGGTASVVMVITDRVQRDIQAYAESENLARGEAEAIAIDQLRTRYSDLIGGEFELSTYYGTIGTNVMNYVTEDTTAIALPEQLATGKLVRRIVNNSGRPVIVAPSSTSARIARTTTGAIASQ